MTKFFLKTAIFLLAAWSGAERLYAERICGLERMARFDLLPELFEGTRALQISSRDRLGGNDGDGYYATHPCLYTAENGEKVLFEEMQPGCLYRFWMTFTSQSMSTNRLRFYFDGEEAPRLDITVNELFCGTNAPFLFPLVGDGNVSCKGYYSYYPFEYRQSLKVTIDWVPTGTGTAASPFYYNMTFHRFDSAKGVRTWDGSEDASPVIEQLIQTGSDPKLSDGNTVETAVLNIAPGEVSYLLNAIGPGTVQSLRLDPSPATADAIQNCHIVMNWDGGDEEVNVPLGSFFGSETDEMEVRSLPIGMTTNGFYYCFFPMPYWESASICISNSGSAPVSIPYEIQYAENPYDRDRCGYFHAAYKNQLITNDGKDVPFITAQGRGHFAGLSLFIRAFDYSGNNLDHLEGDERMYFDGSLSPAIYGTGAEDYFNCAWYFKNAPALLPYHGCALQEFNPAPPNETQAYRFHLSDALPFYTDFRFGMEHGRKNDASGLYSSVAYFYLQPPTGWVQMAEFDVSSAEAFAYQAQGASAVSNSWCYEGENDREFVSAEGISFSGASQFSVPLDVNAGVVLRRLTDRGIGRQKASVYVDGTFAGTWYDADCNFLTARLYNTTTYRPVNQRWNESEFLIPTDLTIGKTNLHVRIERDPDGADSWNEYRYAVYGLTPLGNPDDVDGDGLPDRWETTYFNHAGMVHPDEDSDGDGQSNYEEWIAGTSPSDPASVFEIRRTAGENEFFARSNRVYQLWFSTDLSSAESWQCVSTFEGTDSVYTLPQSSPRGF